MRSIKDSKVAQIFSSLGRKEQQKFLLFVQSPYFNTHEATTHFAEYLLGPPCCNWSTVTKKDISKAIFPNEVYRETRINALMTKSLKLFKRFLIYYKLEERPAAEEFALDNALSFNLHDLFAKQYEKVEQVAQTSDNFHHQYQLDVLKIKWLDDTEVSLPPQLMAQTNTHLECWFFEQRLEHANRLVQLAQTTKQAIDTSSVTQLYEELNHQWKHLLDVPIIKLYYYRLLIIWGEATDEHYYRLKHFFNSHYDEWSREVQYNTYRSITNYCIRKTNAGDVGFQQETMELYKRLIAHDFILKNDAIHQVTYSNILALACLQKDFEWAKNFAQEFKPYLAPEVRKNAYYFNTMNILYCEKDYSAALDIMQKVNFTNIYFQAITKLIQIKIYYELAEWLLLDATLNSFNLFIMRTKKTGLHTDELLIFVKFVRRLSKLEERAQTFSKAKLARLTSAMKEEIINLDRKIANKSWLLERLKELRRS